jgi:hypothetical protein
MESLLEELQDRLLYGIERAEEEEVEETGRALRYRERIRYEMESVVTKDVRGVITHALREDSGQSRAEAEVLAERSLGWLRTQAGVTAPGTMRVSVPATHSRKYARVRRLRDLRTGQVAAERALLGISHR